MPTLPITDLEKRAYQFAKEKHAGVFRKFSGVSYFDGHVQKVFGLVKQYTTDESSGAAALLHDVCEDCDVTYDDIRNEFGNEVAGLVKELTSSEEFLGVMGKSDYLLDKMATMSERALTIKLCDRLQNISDSYVATERFRNNYYKETRYIINGLKENRDLNQIHNRIINQIEGLLNNIQARYKYESKSHIMMFEDFKQNNISIEDVIRCIDSGGSLYATIIRNFPKNDPDIALNPVSIDEYGTVTVELDGSNYEVELKNIDRIEW